MDRIGVPTLVWIQIRDSPLYSSEDEKRVAVLKYCLQTVPGVSWGRIAGALWRLEEHMALENVRQYISHKPGEYITYYFTCIVHCNCTCTYTGQGNTTQQKHKATQWNLPKAVIENFAAVGGI